MASPRERDYRSTTARSPSYAPSYAPSYSPNYAQQLTRTQRRQAVQPNYHRHHFDVVPPSSQPRYQDYIYVDRLGWWPRWFPYWEPSWYAYWWRLYDHYGGNARPEYAKSARDTFLRQHAQQFGLVVSGSYAYGVGADNPDIVRDHRGTPAIVRDHWPSRPGFPGGVVLPVRLPPAGPSSPPQVPEHHDPDPYRPHYQHPHHYYGDYVTVEGVWWPRWFPYWDPAWNKYWWQLYYYYGGDAYRDYAEYVRDMILRSYAPQMGWL